MRRAVVIRRGVSEAQSEGRTKHCDGARDDEQMIKPSRMMGTWSSHSGVRSLGRPGQALRSKPHQIND